MGVKADERALRQAPARAVVHLSYRFPDYFSGTPWVYVGGASLTPQFLIER